MGNRISYGSFLPRGAYGVVWKAASRKSGDTVALKKCFDAFQNATGMLNTFPLWFRSTLFQTRKEHSGR